MTRFVKVSQEILLTLGAILGVICILATISAVFFGVTPLVFRSGSMAPAISTGALALAQNVPGDDIRVGDIVSALNPQGTRVTHRVVSIADRAGDSVALTMRGDANEIADPEAYTVTSADRVIWHLDGLGYVVQEAQKPPYVFALGLLAGGLFVFSVRSRRAERAADETEEPPTESTLGSDPSPDTVADDAPGDASDLDVFTPPASSDDNESALGSEPSSTAHRGRVVARIVTAVLLPLTVVGAMSVGEAVDTQAAFTDQTRASSATLASSLGTAFQPTSVVCTSTGTGGKTMTITWSVATNAPNAGYAISGGPTASPTQTTTAGKVSVSFPEGAMPLNSYTMTVSAKHFTNWTTSASPLTVTINTSNRKVNCA